jgi:hypothetical protein
MIYKYSFVNLNILSMFVFPALLYIIFLKDLSLPLSTTINGPLKARQKN